MARKTVANQIESMIIKAIGQSGASCDACQGYGTMNGGACEGCGGAGHVTGNAALADMLRPGLVVRYKGQAGDPANGCAGEIVDVISCEQGRRFVVAFTRPRGANGADRFERVVSPSSLEWVARPDGSPTAEAVAIELTQAVLDRHARAVARARAESQLLKDEQARAAAVTRQLADALAEVESLKQQLALRQTNGASDAVLICTEGRRASAALALRLQMAAERAAGVTN